MFGTRRYEAERLPSEAFNVGQPLSPDYGIVTQGIADSVKANRLIDDQAYIDRIGQAKETRKNSLLRLGAIGSGIGAIVGGMSLLVPDTLSAIRSEGKEQLGYGKFLIKDISPVFRNDFWSNLIVGKELEKQGVTQEMLNWLGASKGESYTGSVLRLATQSPDPGGAYLPDSKVVEGLADTADFVNRKIAAKVPVYDAIKKIIEFTGTGSTKSTEYTNKVAEFLIQHSNLFWVPVGGAVALGLMRLLKPMKRATDFYYTMRPEKSTKPLSEYEQKTLLMQAGQIDDPIIAEQKIQASAFMEKRRLHLNDLAKQFV